MQIIDAHLDNITLEYPLDKIAPLEDILFIDIETTGFSYKTSKLYLIGCVYYDNGFKTKQFFADEYSDEKEILNEFFYFAKSYKTLIHFNGNNFDIPYILGKCSEYNLPYSFDDFTGLDIYKRIFPYKNFLKLENCKQKTIESFLNICREDKYSGGDLISIYHKYVSNKDKELKELLLLHNFEDIKGMLEILPVLAYSDIFTNPLKVTKVYANFYKTESGNESSEVIMKFDLPVRLCVPITYFSGNIYFSGSESEGTLRVPLFEGELKFFYANYKDYYYLPAEDTALHKSVSAFVDKNFRRQANKSDCYTRKTGKFLPEWSTLIEPFFKSTYESNDLYFELTDERRTDRKLFSEYASHVLNHIC